MTRRLSDVRRAILACLALSTPWASPAGAQAPEEDVEISVEAAPASPPAPAPSAAPSPAPEVNALEAKVKALEARLAELSAQAEAERSAREALDARVVASEQSKVQKPDPTLLERVARAGVTLSGYIQVQYGRNELSEDQLLQGGSPLNQNRFAVRRGRLRLKGRWKYVQSDFELDGSNTRGPTVSVRRASLSGVLPGAGQDEPPLLLLTAGLTEIPLGLELQQGQDDILFLERTTGSLAFFAGPVDTGVKLEGAYGPLRLQLAVMNGVPLDDRAGGPSGIDPTSAPDYLGRVGVDLTPLDTLHLAAGASFLAGTGFHPGSDATKSVLQWDDKNADGQFSTTEVVQIAGRAAIPSKTFDRWAVAVDAQVGLHTKAGWSKLYGELTLATNLDRSLYVADPTLTGSDVRELSWYVAFLQDVTAWGFVGARYDVYDPNSDFVDSRRGKTVAGDAAIKTLSPVAGLRWSGVGRLTFQYDWVDDKLARDRRGVPTDVANNQWTVRLQGQF